MGDAGGLAAALRRIDGKSYNAYKDLQGRWQMASYSLCIDRVQGDPFASPSRCRVVVPATVAGLPPALLSSRARRTAVCDYLTRSFGSAVSASGGTGALLESSECPLGTRACSPPSSPFVRPTHSPFRR